MSSPAQPTCKNYLQVQANVATQPIVAFFATTGWVATVAKNATVRRAFSGRSVVKQNLTTGFFGNCQGLLDSSNASPVASAAFGGFIHVA